MRRVTQKAEEAGEPETTERDRRRRTFGPVVAAGLATAALAVVAGGQPFARGRATGGIGELSAAVEAGRVPAANALALVVLACWGVLLLTRGKVRRALGVLAVLASLGVVAAVVLGFGSAPDAVREAYRNLGADNPEVARTTWFWVALIAALLSVAASAYAVRLIPAWPEMGRRYDAPGPAPAPAPAEEPENLDLWKAIDQGRDPTA